MSMQAIMAASQSMARMQTMQHSRTQLQGTANILRSESRQDGGNQKKLDEADALDEKSNSLMGDLMGEINDVNETLKPDEDATTEETGKEESTEKSPKTDIVEISDTAIKQLSKEGATRPAVLAAVTYTADGSTKPSTAANVVPIFEATA